MSSKTQAPVNATTKPSLNTDKSGLLQRQCACGNSAGLTGECATCQKEKLTLQRKQTATQDDVSEVPPIAHEVLSLPHIMQAKLTIGASDDPLEREADRVADQILAAPVHPAVGSAPPRIQRFTGKTAGQTDMAAPASVDRVLSSPGRPLEPTLQKDMGQRFGHDFSQVRVHTDAAAERSAREVNTNAYTVGHNIVFGTSQFAPETHEGRRLIAHELTHVVQQNQESSVDPTFQLQRAPDGNQLTPKDRQLACVVRLGGCTSATYSRDAGTANEHIPKYNKTCIEKEKTNYVGDDIYPSPDQCNNPPKEPLPTGAKILLGTFFVVGSGLAIAGTIVAAEAVIPIVIASIVETGTAGLAFYFANAIVVNEIGLFAAGVLMACEGDVLGLISAIATDPEQAVKLLAEVYILHTSISVNNGPPRRATIPAKLLPTNEQQANSKQIRFKTVGPPQFEHTKAPEQAPSPPVPAPKAAPPPVAAKAPVTPETAPPPTAKTPSAPKAALPPAAAKAPATDEVSPAAAKAPATPKAETLEAEPVLPPSPKAAPRSVEDTLLEKQATNNQRINELDEKIRDLNRQRDKANEKAVDFQNESQHDKALERRRQATNLSGQISEKELERGRLKTENAQLADRVDRLKTGFPSGIGPPPGKRHGGAHESMEAWGGERNHIPPDSVSNIGTGKGPAIWMETKDHQKTKSWGSGNKAKEWRSEQEKLIKQGKVREAIQKDIDDIQGQFSDKYNKGIEQMLNYIDTLNPDDFVRK